MLTYDELLRLHAHWAALAEAGVNVDASLGNSATSVRTTLEACGVQIAKQMRQDVELATAVAQCDDLPAGYRAMVLKGLRTGRLPAALEPRREQAAAWAEVRDIVGGALFYPMLLAALAALGLIFLCLVYSPTLEGMYDQMGTTPSWSVRLLMGLRASLWAWGPAVAVLLLGGAWLWRRERALDLAASGGRRRWLSRVPGVRGYIVALEQARVAQQMADLMEAGEARDVSMQRLCEEREVSEGVAMRPFLRWALASSLERPQLIHTLRFAADAYQQSAQRRLAVLGFAVPAVACATLGAAAVLCYGLLVFAPMTSLLETLGQAIGPR